MKMTYTNKQKKILKGFTLVEVLVYIAVFTLISFALVQTTISVNKAYLSIKSNQMLEISASDSLNRISNDIRNVRSILIDSSSIFDVSPGRLTLSVKDNLGKDKIVEYYVDGFNMLQVKENGMSVGKLTSSLTPVSNLVFKKIDTGSSSAIKIDMTLQAFKSGVTTTESFYSTYILRIF
jgi:hypothetical protein